MPFCPESRNAPSLEQVVSLLNVGLTGGMGSGKSAVSSLLASHGAVIVDHDKTARDIVKPGRAALRLIAERFGPEVLLPDGSLNRPALAGLVFNGDENARKDLNRITHPRIGRSTREQYNRALARLGDQAIVIQDSPLLYETNAQIRYIGVIVVEAPVELRIQRLQAGRGIDAEEARKRIAVQASDEQRRTIARWVVVNDGDMDDLAVKVGELWAALQKLNAKVNAEGLDGSAPIPLSVPLD
ncbi:MAG: dephospho-CoA kinase [Pseudonocardiales bacterium]|nr:dephospho-CoA kinase [Jatrophihabitantaceae bacterium]MCW2604591.1 dephospho-CoA kinase [Pseudonocardiales bacterium]